MLTRITSNRVWGYRPTTEAVTCGGSGANGQAVTAGNYCPGHVFVARNVIADSTIGISVAGGDWILAGNLLHDIQPSDGHIYGTLAVLLDMDAHDIDIQWNTVVSAMNAYDDRSDDTDTRCNVVLDSPEWIGPGHPRGTNHVTEYNYLFQSGYSNFVGPTNEFYANLVESSNQTLCYKRRRWTTQETICVPYAATGPASPQRDGAPFCDADIGASFGMPTTGYWANQPTGGCGIGGEIAVVVGGIAWWGKRRRSSVERIGSGAA